MGTVSQYDMYNVNACFGWGYDMNSYRGRQYWRDDGSTGTFSGGTIYMSDFLGTRPDNPEPYPFQSAYAVPFDSAGSGIGIFYGRGAFVNDSLSYFKVQYADNGPHHGALQISIDGVIGRVQMAFNGSRWEFYIPPYAGGGDNLGLANSTRTVRLYANSNS